MTKQQTGLRVDRVLFQRFLKLCALEKLRPGEAVEHLIQKAVDRGAIVDVFANVARPDGADRLLNEAWFRSRLSRLKTSLEIERRYLLDAGWPEEDPESEDLVKQLLDLARRPVSQELVKEFETVLIEADKLWQETQKSTLEGWIKQNRSSKLRTEAWGS